MDEQVKVEVNALGVMLATLNHAETMNSIGPGMAEQFIDAIGRASSDDAVKAVVVTGAGRGFCSGANATAMVSGGATGGPSRHQRMDRRGLSYGIAQAMAECDVPIVAAINGPAAGAGFGIALCSDIRFMAASARVGSIFIKRGTAADFGLSYWLPRIVGVARAFELCYDGGLLDAEQALSAGLVHRVFPDEALLGEAMAYAAKIAAGPPLAYTALRRMLIRSTDMPRPDFLEYEWTNQLSLLATKDCREGFQSFIERREPRFTGE